MSVVELEEELKVIQSLLPAVQAISTIDGTGIDTKNFDSMLVIVNAGVATATGTLDVTLEESSDDGVADAYTAISNAAFTQIDVNNDQTVYIARIKCKNFERYIRTSAVIATDTVTASITVLLGKGDGLIPVSQTNPVEFAINYN